MSVPHPYKFEYEMRKNIEAGQVEYRCTLSFPMSDKTTYHMCQTFEEGMEDKVMSDMFAHMVIDELIPHLKKELPHLFEPDPKSAPDPKEPFVGTLRGVPIRRSDPDWLSVIQNPAFNLNPNVRLT